MKFKVFCSKYKGLADTEQLEKLGFEVEDGEDEVSEGHVMSRVNIIGPKHDDHENPYVEVTISGLRELKNLAETAGESLIMHYFDEKCPKGSIEIYNGMRE